MSTKLLAGLLAMVVVAGVGIYTGVSQFYTTDATPLYSEGSGCCSAKAQLPVSAELAVHSCCSDSEEAAQGCCAEKASCDKTQFVGACVGGAGLAIESKSSDCPNCKAAGCESK